MNSSAASAAIPQSEPVTASYTRRQLHAEQPCMVRIRVSLLDDPPNRERLQVYPILGYVAA